MAENFRKHRIEARKVHLKNVFPSQSQHETWKNLMKTVVFSACCKNGALQSNGAIIKGPHYGGKKAQ